MASSGAGVDKIRIGGEEHGYLYVQVPVGKMVGHQQDVSELWIGRRGAKPNRPEEKLVLVKKGDGVVEAVNMQVSWVVKNGEDNRGEKIQVLDEGSTDVLCFSKGVMIWWWDPVDGESPFEHGKHKWGTCGCEGKSTFNTVKVTPTGGSDGRKRRRLDGQPTIVPQKVIFDGGEELQFTVYATVEPCRG